MDAASDSVECQDVSSYQQNTQKPAKTFFGQCVQVSHIFTGFIMTNVRHICNLHQHHMLKSVYMCLCLHVYMCECMFINARVYAYVCVGMPAFEATGVSLFI